MQSDKTLLYRAFGQRIRELRKKSGLSQKELAHRIGLATGVSITKIERGQQEVTLHQLHLLAQALQSEPKALVPNREGNRYSYDPIRPTHLTSAAQDVLDELMRRVAGSDPKHPTE